MRWFVVLVCTLVLSSAALAAGSNDQMLTALGMPPDTKVEYADENGKPITAEEFARAIAKSGMDIEPIKDAAAKKLTLRLKRGKPGPTHLPPFDAKDLSGRRIRNSDLTAKPTLVNFFFATCAPCIKEVPMLNEFARRHPEYGYVAFTFDSEAEARQFAGQRKFERPIVAQSRKLMDAAAVNGYPTYMLVATDGRILDRHSGLSVDAMKDPATGVKELETWVKKFGK